ncbi:MAG: di-heme-cytochrome C peroxidase [Bdellovibrionota bacterium]
MKKLVFAISICAGVAACTGKPVAVTENTAETYRKISQAAPSAWGTDASAHDLERTTYLDQNWTPQIREAFYRTPQGSHIMPMKFALALKKSGTDDPFFTSKNLAGYGFIPQAANPSTNPFGLPVGMTIDGKMQYSTLKGHSVENGERMLGVNCSACHTGSMHYKGQAIRIDGGQALLDFQGFVHDMDYALRETLEDPARLNRFLDSVATIDKTGASSDRNKLLDQLKATVHERGMWTNLNHDGINYGNGYNETKFIYTPGRLDAFSVIFNQVLARDLAVPGNAGEPNVPVSIPVIWDAPQHDWLQWNGLASNSMNQGGPIARNIGQVLGVFGHIDFGKNTKILHGYCSTARRTNLDLMENWLGSLWSPQWPTEVFGQLDPVKVARGKELFQKSCVACHDPINRADPNRTITAKLVPMSEVGTETRFNDVALARVADTTTMAGKLTRLLEGRKLEAREPAATLLRYAVAGSIAGSISPLTCGDNIDVTRKEYVGTWKEAAKRAVGGGGPSEADDNPDKDTRTAALIKKLAVYKARPLNGIWSSPPFLHNGSVASLYDLMLPPSERKGFYVGCDEFDPVKAGWSCPASSGKPYFDTSIPGNTPVGHDFGPKGENAEADRWALVEYVKSL